MRETLVRKGIIHTCLKIGAFISKPRHNKSLSKYLLGSNLSAHDLTSPCLHNVPGPHRSFTRMLSRTGLKGKERDNSYGQIYKFILIYHGLRPWIRTTKSKMKRIRSLLSLLKFNCSSKNPRSISEYNQKKWNIEMSWE